jgi:hypothetical protein
MDEAQARRDRLAKQMQELLPSWSLAKVVTGIQALRGGALISAIILVAEIGDFKRFANPRQIMAYLGPRRANVLPAPKQHVAPSPKPASRPAWTRRRRPGRQQLRDDRREEVAGLMQTVVERGVGQIGHAAQMRPGGGLPPGPRANARRKRAFASGTPRRRTSARVSMASASRSRSPATREISPDQSSATRDVESIISRRNHIAIPSVQFLS